MINRYAVISLLLLSFGVANGQISSRGELQSKSANHLQPFALDKVPVVSNSVKKSDKGDFYLDTIYTRTETDSFKYTYNYELQPALMNELCQVYRNGSWENYFRWNVVWEGMKRISTLEYWQNNKWTGSIRETETFLDESTVLSWLAESWNYDHWEKTRGQSRTYESGLLCNQTDEFYGADQLVFRLLTTNVYDDRGMFESFLVQVEEQGVGVNEVRGFVVRNPEGDVETYYFQKWSDSQWTDSSRVYYYYSEPGLDTLIYCQVRSEGEWIDFSKRHRRFDPEERIVYESFIFWKDYYWDNRSRLEWEYNSNGDISIYTYMRGEYNTWQNGYRETYQYEAPGIIKSKLEEFGEGSAWVNGLFYEKYFNNLTQVTGYRSNEWSGSWEPADQQLGLTDAQGNLLFYNCNRADIILNSAFTGNIEYHEAGNIKVYPNPSGGKIFIDVDAKVHSAVSIQAIDLTGRVIDEIYRGSVHQGINNFEWEAGYNGTYSQSNRVYFIRITIGETVVTRKVIVIPDQKH